MFGNDVLKDYKLVYARFKLIQLYTKEGIIEKFPYIKPSNNNQFSISNPVSFCETRALNYLIQSLSKHTRRVPEVKSDEDCCNENNISFCSLGAMSNLKSMDTINSERNIFFGFDSKFQSIINKTSKKKYTIDRNYDYALILKIKSDINSKKTYMCISGIGEWGTSGGAYYISKYWKKFFWKTLFFSEFGAVIRVKHNSDDSAKLMEIIKNK